MSRWILPLLIATVCTQTAFATPVETAVDVPTAQPAPLQASDSSLTITPGFRDSLVARSFEKVGHTVAEQAHTVADNTSALVATAMGFVGLRYRRGGNSEKTGFDCSGLVRAVYEKTAGLVLPRRAKEQAAATKVIDKRDLQPGDLVFFNTMRRAFSHVGVYLGDGKFIHSPRTGETVRVDDLQDSYWKKRFDGARHVMLDEQAVARLSAAATLGE